MFESECKLVWRTMKDQCSNSATIAKELNEGPTNGCLSASVEKDKDQLFQIKDRGIGVQLKLTYGQDSKLEAYRIFLIQYILIFLEG